MTAATESRRGAAPKSARSNPTISGTGSCERFGNRSRNGSAPSSSASSINSYQTLDGWELDFLLEHLGRDQRKIRAGAPKVLAPIHQLIAIHYWWRRQHERQRGVAKSICSLWGLSSQAITKYATRYKQHAPMQGRPTRLTLERSQRWRPRSGQFV